MIELFNAFRSLPGHVADAIGSALEAAQGIPGTGWFLISAACFGIAAYLRRAGRRKG